MAKESQMWRTANTGLKKAAKAAGLHLHLQRVEDAASAGVPDVNLCFDGHEAWIELKSIPFPPKRPGTPLRVRHFTRQQMLWLHAREKAGGKAWLLVRVEREWLLFSTGAAWKVGELPMGLLRDTATLRYTGRVDWAELLATMTGLR